jgi:hypothetical protein
LNTHTIEGYVYPLSAGPGDTLHFFVHEPAPHQSYTVTYLRYGPSTANGKSKPQTVAGPTTFTNGTAQNYDSSAYESGASVNWTQSFQQVIPTTWRSGIYSAQLVDTTSKAKFYVTFVVKDAPASTKRIAVVAATNTWAAYNFWPADQGGSFYQAPCTTNRSSWTPSRNPVSFLRPNPYASPIAIDQTNACSTKYRIDQTEHLAAGEIYITRWLEREGWQYSMLTDSDVDSNPAALDPTVYSTVILPTHSEYWTPNMYSAVRSYIARGGNVLVLSGNTAYRQVSLSNTVTGLNGSGQLVGNSTVSYTSLHSATECSGCPENPAETSPLDVAVVPQSQQAQLLGLASYIHSAPGGGCKGYGVLAPYHWTFSGLSTTELSAGLGGNGFMVASAPCEVNGNDTNHEPEVARAAAGWEVDRAYNPGVVTRKYEIVGRGQTSVANFADMVYYQQRSTGQVFNVGSITFGQSLLWDSYQAAHPMSTAIENVLVRFENPVHTDFSGDGIPDVLTVDGSGNLALYRGNGHGNFETSGTQVDTNWDRYSHIYPVGEFAGDGTQDVLAKDASGNLHLYRGNGQGGFIQDEGPIVDSGWNTYNLIIPMGDFAGDGTDDVLARDASGNLHLFRGDGHRHFIQDGGPIVDSGWNAYNLIVPVGDFTGDGSPDLLARDASGNLWLYDGNGHGGFFQAGSGAAAPHVIDTNWNRYSMIIPVGNFTGDGATDDVLARDGSGNLHLYRGSGQGFIQDEGPIVNTGWGGFLSIEGVW